MPIHDDTADSKPPVPAEDDLTLFRREMKDVARLDTDRVPPLRRRLRPVPLKTIENEQQVLVDMLSDQTWGEHELETGEELLYLKPGVQTRLLQRLRRGHFAVAAVLDLHGLSVTEARDALSVFLRECLLRQLTEDMPYYEEVKALVTDHLEDLRDNRLPQIQRRTGYSVERIQLGRTLFFVSIILALPLLYRVVLRVRIKSLEEEIDRTYSMLNVIRYESEQAELAGGGEGESAFSHKTNPSLIGL